MDILNFEVSLFLIALTLTLTLTLTLSREDRVRENLRAFDRGFALDDDDMAAIAALEGRVTKT